MQSKDSVARSKVERLQAAGQILYLWQPSINMWLGVSRPLSSLGCWYLFVLGGHRKNRQYLSAPWRWQLSKMLIPWMIVWWTLLWRGEFVPECLHADSARTFVWMKKKSITTLLFWCCDRVTAWILRGPRCGVRVPTSVHMTLGTVDRHCISWNHLLHCLFWRKRMWASEGTSFVCVNRWQVCSLLSPHLEPLTRYFQYLVMRLCGTFFDKTNWTLWAKTSEILCTTHSKHSFLTTRASVWPRETTAEVIIIVPLLPPLQPHPLLAEAQAEPGD